MPDTPKHLVSLLDNITGEAAPTIESVGNLGARHFSRVRDMFEDPNILGVGVSEKIAGETPTGVLTVCFYVRKKLPRAKIKSRNMIPPVLAGSHGEACYTDVKALGLLKPQLLKKRTPIESGFSVGHVKITAGTVGAIVRKGTKLYILSNSHVLADSGRGKAGDAILYPGKFDGGKKATDVIAKLSAFGKFTKGGSLVNLIDAAIAEILPARAADVAVKIPGTKAPLAMIAPKREMVVTKRGRTTETSTGRIIDTDFRFVLTYPGVGEIGFTHQVLCERYTDGGDSGSLVIDTKSKKIVGLHFAGAEGGSVFNPISEVIAALGFQFTAK
ncbi:MAG: hypothetical protein ABI995_02240 [Acidobacteriota bacterium]